MRELFRLLRALRPYWLTVALAPVLMVVEVGLDLWQPRFVQRIIDEGVLKSDTDAILHHGLLMIGAATASVVFGMGCQLAAARAAYGMAQRLRVALFRNVQAFSLGQLAQHDTSSLVTRYASDVNQIQEMVSMLLRGMVRMPLLLVGSIVLGCAINPGLGSVFLFIVPILVTALLLVLRRTFPLYRLLQARLERLNGVVQENLAGIRVIKAFGRSAHERDRFQRANEDLAAENTRAVAQGAVLGPVLMLTVNFGLVACLALGARHVSAGALKVGEVVAFLHYLVQSLHALMLFSNLVLSVSRAQASARRLVPLLEMPPKEAEVLGARRRRRIGGTGAGLEFERVTFAYASNSSHPVLSDISFKVEPGETLVVLGPTGAGKSTLLSLIPRFGEVSSGRVLLDGVDVRRIPLSELRERIGFGFQDPFLFGRSVVENLRLSDPDADTTSLDRALKEAQAEEFVCRLPEGLATRLGQRGMNLSGGQRQRLALARTLLPRPSLLLLDDCTSAVDVATENAMLQALASRDLASTRLIVAQRMSAVAHAQRVLLLDHGRVAGWDTPERLRRTNVLFQSIHESQNGGSHGVTVA